MGVGLIAATVGVQIVSGIMQYRQAAEARRQQENIARAGLEQQLEEARIAREKAIEEANTTAQLQAEQAIKNLNDQYKQIAHNITLIDKEINEMEAAFEAVKPPDVDLDITDPPDLATERIPPTAFDFSQVTPQELNVVGKFSPAIAEYVKEVKPTLPKDLESAESKQGMAAQMAALQKFRDIAGQETDPELAGMLQKASQRAQIEAQSRAQSILQQRARRGRLGSGDILASQMAGAESAQQRAAMEGQQAAEAAYRNRLQALSQGAQLGGQVRAQEGARESREADVINRFNERTSQRYQQHLQRAADTQNQAQLQNLQEAQRIAEANILRGDEAAVRERDSLNQLLAQQRQEQVGERSAINQAMAQQYGLERDYEQDIQALKQQQYANALRQAQMRQSISQQRIGALNAAGDQRLRAMQQYGQGMQGALGQRQAAISGALGSEAGTRQRGYEGFYPAIGQARLEHARQAQGFTQSMGDIGSAGISEYGEYARQQEKYDREDKLRKDRQRMQSQQAISKGV